MKLISTLKKLPIDLGQAEFKHQTAGKRIALSCVEEDGTGKKILDIGCRDGYFSEYFKSLGYESHALDISPQYEDAIKCDVEEGLPYENNEFDVVWCSEVIEHLHDPEFLLSEVDRVLNKGGLAVLTTPNSRFWFYRLVGLWGWTPQKLQNPDHKQYFDLKVLKELAPDYEICGYFPYFTFFSPKINSLVGFFSPTFILIGKKAK